jgi:hypothetical protein
VSDQRTPVPTQEGIDRVRRLKSCRRQVGARRGLARPRQCEHGVRPTIARAANAAKLSEGQREGA